MEISLKPSGLWDRFEGRIYSGYDYGPKPKPDMLQQIMKDAGVTPDRTVMIDDMPAGFHAAQAAGVKCFAYMADGDQKRADGTNAIKVATMAEIQKASNLT